MKTNLKDYIFESNQSISDIEKIGFKPQSETEAFKINLQSPNFDQDISNFDNNWYFLFHILKFLNPYIIDYFRISKNKKEKNEHSNLVLNVLKKYIPHCLKKKYKDKQVWEIAAVSHRLYKILFLIDIAEDENFNKLDIKYLKKIATIHVFSILKDIKYTKSWNNHHLMGLVALELYDFVFGNYFFKNKIKEIVKKTTYIIIDKLFSEEGITKEHSAIYQIHNLKYFKKPSMQRINLKSEIILKAEQLSNLFKLPNGNIIAFGASNNSISKQNLNSNNNGKNIKDLDYLIQDFYRSGINIIRSNSLDKNNFLLFFTGMRHSRVHKHDDDMSFILYDLDNPIFIDAGQYTYSTKKEDKRNYFESQVFHNTAGSEEFDQKKRNLNFYQSCLNKVITNQSNFICSGTLCYEDFTHKRIIKYKPNKRLIIKDSFKSIKEKNYVSRLLFHPDVRVKLINNKVFFKLLNGAMGIIQCSHNGIKKFYGSRDPFKGFMSTAYQKMIPTNLLEVLVIDKAELEIEWQINLCDPKTKIL